LAGGARVRGLKLLAFAEAAMPPSAEHEVIPAHLVGKVRGSSSAFLAIFVRRYGVTIGIEHDGVLAVGARGGPSLPQLPPFLGP